MSEIQLCVPVWCGFVLQIDLTQLQFPVQLCWCFWLFLSTRVRFLFLFVYSHSQKMQSNFFLTGSFFYISCKCMFKCFSARIKTRSKRRSTDQHRGMWTYWLNWLLCFVIYCEWQCQNDRGRQFTTWATWTTHTPGKQSGSGHLFVCLFVICEFSLITKQANTHESISLLQLSCPVYGGMSSGKRPLLPSSKVTFLLVIVIQTHTPCCCLLMG